MDGESVTRQEHLDWAKRRALDYLNAGDARNAVTSMLSDLTKHPELKNHPGGMMGAMLVLGGHLHTDREVRKWIEGFN